MNIHSNYAAVWRVVLWIMLLITVQPSAAHAAKHFPTAPKIVVSVLPVHALVAALMSGLGAPQLLTSGGQSPHLNSLKPSQVQLLQTADLIVWIGPLLEPSLEKIIHQQRDAVRIVTLMEQPAITLLPRLNGDGLFQHEHADQHAAETNQTSSHDPHIWLSFANAKAIVRIVTRELAQLDSANRDRYALNADALIARLKQLQQSMYVRVRAAADIPYVVFHDAYRYFEEEFGLQPVAVLAIHPHRPPGANRIRRLKRLIRTHKVQCVFSEPQFRRGLVHTLVAGSNAKMYTLDPLGIAVKPGAEAWFQLMQGIADSFADCLR